MKSVDNTLIKDVLKNTEFENLIEKFESSGDVNLRNLTLLNNQGQLLNYLKNFEKDEKKLFRLQKLLMDEMIESSKPVVNFLGFGLIGLLILILLLLLL